VGKEDAETTRLSDITGWVVRDVQLYQDIISNISSVGDPDFEVSRINYSRFSGSLRIERSDPGVILKSFLPILVIIPILYAMHFMPSNWLVVRMTVFMGAFFTNADCHLKLLSDLPVEYITVIEYAFLGVYVLTTISVIISVSAYILARKRFPRIAKIPDWLARIAYPLVIAGAVVYVNAFFL